MNRNAPIDELKQAQYLMGDRPSVVTPLAYAQAKAGRRHEAQETLEKLQRISKPRPSPFRIVYVDIGLGNIDQAFDGLKKAVVARDWQMGMLKVEPAFDALRSDPRFDALLKSAGSNLDNRAPSEIPALRHSAFSIQFVSPTS